MTATAQRRLAVVACCTVTGEPDGTHLAVEEWSPRWQEWLTGMALCGQSADQGALPTGTAVTCASCEGHRDHYERALAGRLAADSERAAGIVRAVSIGRRAPAGRLIYLANRLEAALEDGTLLPSVLAAIAVLRDTASELEGRQL